MACLHLASGKQVQTCVHILCHLIAQHPRPQGHPRMGSIPNNPPKAWAQGDNEESSLAQFHTSVHALASLHFIYPLLSQVQRGTIKCRRDPSDPEEWQFALVKSIAYHNTQHSHELQAEASGKMEALDWIKARTAGAMMGGEDAETAEAALNDVLPDKKKGLKLWP